MSVNRFPAIIRPTSKYLGPSYENVRKSWQDRTIHRFQPYYKNPLLIQAGKFQWLYGHDGKQYLDMYAGIASISVGHCHPRLVKALQEQVEQLGHVSNRYMHSKLHEYTEKLMQKFPRMDKVIFTNSGSEANDIAIMMARLHTGNVEIISLRNGYHGSSGYTMGMTAGQPLPGMNNGIVHAMGPDVYGGIWGGKQCRDCVVPGVRECTCEAGCCQATENYLTELESTFSYSLPEKIAGMFVESIQGVGGVVQLPRGFLKSAAKTVRNHGGLFIVDEVQTGMGRTGEHFWSYEGHDLSPDIVTVAKGIGNGFPLAAVVTRNEIAESFEKAHYFNTFGGSPLALTAGSVVLDIFEEEGLQLNALNVGTYFLKGLEELRREFEIIGDIRGKGLMIGVELVSNREKRTPLDAQRFQNILETMKDFGVLCGTAGLLNQTILRITPPLCITKTDADMALDVLRASLDIDMMQITS